MPGRCFSISIDACSPFISGIAMSMHDDVGLELLHERERLEAVARFADDGDVRVVFQDAAEPLPYQRVVVDEHHADRLLLP